MITELVTRELAEPTEELLFCKILPIQNATQSSKTL